MPMAAVVEVYALRHQCQPQLLVLVAFGGGPLICPDFGLEGGAFGQILFGGGPPALFDLA